LITRFTPSGTIGIRCAEPLAGYYLNNGYFVLVNQASILLAKIDFASRSVAPFGTAELGVHRFQGTISLLPVNLPSTTKSLIVIAGSQSDLEGAAVMTQIVEWRITGNAPYLTVHPASSLLPTTRLAAYRDEVRACYVAPDTHHPQGVILFTYVDNRTGIPMLVRGKLEQAGPNGQFLWILPSPHILISNIPYYSWPTSNRTIGPQFLCPRSAGKAGLLLQAEPPQINSFIWHGGYRLAGVAESSATAGQSVSVTRIGTAVTAYPYQPGFSYFANNTGFLHSTLSLNEHFTPFGLPYRIGAAIAEQQLLLEFEVIDRMNNAFW